MSKLRSTLYTTLFFFLVLLAPIVFVVYAALLYPMLIGLALYWKWGIRNTITKWCAMSLLSADQSWQVFLAPVLNKFATDIKAKFGDEDQTASSVIGKNKLLTNAAEWCMIDAVLSKVLNSNHSVGAIEKDEGNV